MKVKLIWNPNIERWIMRDLANYFIEEFRDCKNFNMIFGLDKNKVNIVEINAKVIKYNDKDS